MKKNILVKAGDRMAAQTVEMTQDEIAELTRQQAELPEQEPTLEERMEAQVLYTALMTDTLLEV